MKLRKKLLAFLAMLTMVFSVIGTTFVATADTTGTAPVLTAEKSGGKIIVKLAASEALPDPVYLPSQED